MIYANGLVSTIRVYDGKHYDWEENWVRYDDKAKKIFFRMKEFPYDTWSEIVERYKVLSITKDEMKIEFNAYSELEPTKPIITRAVFRRLKDR